MSVSSAEEVVTYIVVAEEHENTPLLKMSITTSHLQRGFLVKVDDLDVSSIYSHIENFPESISSRSLYDDYGKF